MSYETKPDEGRYNRKIRFALLNRNVSFAEAVDLIFHLHDAASLGAPQAVQAADRFHLVKNLVEAVEKALRHCRAELPRGPEAEGPADAEAPMEPLASLLTADGHSYSAHQAERYDRYQQVVALHKQGMKIREIASRLGMGQRTVQSWLAHDSYPETRYHARRHRSRFDAYAPYVKQRWDQGCHNVQLMRD